MSVRVAAVEAEALPGAISANLETAARLTRAAAGHRAELVVFPEAFVTGYDDAVFGGELPTADELGWLDPLQHVVDETGTVVVLNTALDRGADPDAHRRRARPARRAVARLRQAAHLRG